MESSVKVVLLDDHYLVMEGLKNRLQEESDIQVVAAFTDPRELLKELPRYEPDVVIMDISMPHMDGFELTIRLKREYGSKLKIVILSGYDYEEFYRKAYEAGASAFLSKQATYGQIINAIQMSLSGHVLVTEKYARPQPDKLTPTEREVLKAIAKEKTNKEIAEEMGVSQRTVEYHLASINQKLGAKTRIGAVVRGYERGILGWGDDD